MRGPAFGDKVIALMTQVVHGVMWVKNATGWVPMTAPNGTEVLRETTATTSIFSFNVSLELNRTQWDTMEDAVVMDMANRLNVPKEQVNVVEVVEGSSKG